MTSNVYTPGSAPVRLARRASKTQPLQPAPLQCAYPVQMVVSEEEWTQLHLALGLCPQRAFQWLVRTDQLLGERYQRALREQVTPDSFGDYPLLHDPLEDDPQWHDAFQETEEMLAFELELAEMEDGPGYCLFVWQIKAHILREEFDLVWFSPAQMNPFRRFA